MTIARRTHRIATSTAAILLALTSVAACAQTLGGQRAEHMRTELRKRFGAADTNVDGQLTRDEASKMPWVSKNFDAIDTTRKGSVTLAEIEAYAMTQRGARQAGK